MTEQQQRFLASLTEMQCFHLLRKIDRRYLYEGDWDWPTFHAVYPQTAVVYTYCLQRAPRFV